MLFPSAAFAQATLTGTVRDNSGGVLPGVTVEAASPALIEKVRTAVTDGVASDRIVDLRAGTYTLKFTLPGFITVERKTSTWRAARRSPTARHERGGMQETITVTGETPVVDVQSARREVVLDQEVIQAIPATRSVGGLLNTRPG